ncbi:heme-binding protein [Ramlibacter sp.]|uniref:heme-binding protein n=1 Tax=Ramlibacter sp. TaxID=1917967 RepID=UPI002602E899|nr:heme-binding protein [Ramlibacter sp.]MDB5953824.1 glcG protein [Ramlibacter sp.]
MYVASTQRLTLAGAREIVAAATASAEASGIAISVVVVDAGGHPVLIERMEGGRFHTVHSAAAKAICAASNRRPTGPAGAQGQALDAIHAIGLALAAGSERWTALEGGCPIVMAGECIGGVGVSGGSFEFDDRVAREAVEAIGATW